MSTSNPTNPSNYVINCRGELQCKDCGRESWKTRAVKHAPRCDLAPGRTITVALTETAPRENKAAAHRRVWEPDSSFTAGGIRRSVRRWTWTPTDGLKVEYLDGMVAKSSYRTLKDFLAAVQEGREGSVREVSEPTEREDAHTIVPS